MALIIVESDAAQEDGAALFSRNPSKQSYQFDDFQGIDGGVANTTTPRAHNPSNNISSFVEEDKRYWAA